MGKSKRSLVSRQKPRYCSAYFFTCTKANVLKNEAKAPPRSIQTPQELKLLHDIVKRETGTREYLELLKTPALGTNSKAAKGEWEFIRAKLAALEELQLWQELFDECNALLAKAHAHNDAGTAEDTRGGDWSVWTAYMRAAEMLKSQE